MEQDLDAGHFGGLVVVDGSRLFVSRWLQGGRPGLVYWKVWIDGESDGIWWNSYYNAESQTDVALWAGRLCVVDSLHFWHMGASYGPSVAVRTQDGGLTWEPFTPPSMFGGYDMSFVDTATGCAAVDDVDTVMKTTDAGNSWTGHAYIPGARRIQMFDKLSGWVLADSGLLRTSNGGDSWTLVVAETALTALRFCDAGFGVAVGKGGAILRTNDSGATWHRDTVDNPVNLYAVCVLDSTHAWAAGDEGVVLGLGDRSIPHIDEPVQAYRGLGVGRLWPNPCSGTLWLRVGGKSGLVHVYDDSGRRVRTVSCASDRTLEVDVSDLPTGVYIARFAAQRSANVRFVILRYRPRPGCS